MAADSVAEIWRDANRIREVQQARLLELLNVVSQSNPFWQQRFAAHGIDAGDIRTLDDLSQLPVTQKSDLIADQAANLPYGTNLSYPISHYARFHQTSGTSGSPLRVPDTAASWDWFMECWRQIYSMMGLREDDRVLFPFSFGPFIGFWAAFEGACRMQRMCLPAGGLSTEQRLLMIADNAVTVVCCVPTYALRVAEVAKSIGFDLAGSSVRLVVVAGEPGGSIPSIRKRIEDAWGARVIDHWGMTEIGSLASEHINEPGQLMVLETECIAEIVEPATFKPVATGETGELLITNLGRVGTPVIRYRTGDLVRAATHPSPTGLQLLRLDGGVTGRIDQMVTIRGNNVFPSNIEAILREFNEVVEWRIEVSTVREMQHLQLQIELQPQLEDAAAFQNQLAKTLHTRLGFQIETEFVPPESLPRFAMKSKRFHRLD